MFTTDIEDERQRHPIDRPGALFGSDLRKICERTPTLQLIIAAAGVRFVRDVALGAPDAVRHRIVFDTSSIWGPFVDDLKNCIDHIGVTQFAFGTHAALREPEAAVVRIELTELDDRQRAAVCRDNLLRAAPGLRGHVAH
jgi:hypothetical protein